MQIIGWILVLAVAVGLIALAAARYGRIYAAESLIWLAIGLLVGAVVFGAIMRVAGL
jgi:hypothetical protein